MACLKVEKFFSLSLPKATLTIGFLTIFLGLLQVITTVMYLYFNDGEEEDYTTRSYRYMHIEEISIFAHSLGVISGVLLIIGTIKKSHRLLIPFLVMLVPAVINTTRLMIFCIVRSIIDWNSGGFKSNHLSIVGYLLVTAFQVYQWIAVYSFNCKMREEKNREKRVQYNSQPESAYTADEECNPKHAFQRI